MSYYLSPMNENNARKIINWHYHESLDFYNYNPS